MKTTGWVLFGVLLGATGARTQDVAVPAAAPAATAPKLVGWLLVLDKPYTAVRDYDRDQKKADGKKYTLHETTKMWRDSAGRLRSEVTREHERVVWTYVTDPSAKVQYRWNNESKIAFVVKIGDPVPTREQAHPLAEGEVRDVTTTIDGKRYKARVSLLPPKTIDGLATVGTHQIAYSDAARTVVYSTTDTWYQQDFRVALEQVIVDEQYGHRVFHFKSFKPEEAKADMFQVPKGYTLKAQETPDTEQFE